MAATLPQALQSGIVYYPPMPQGSRQEGGHQAERAPTNGTGDRWTQNTLRMRGDKALNDMRQNEKKKKNKEKKSGLVIVPTPGLGHTLEGGGKGGRQEDRVVRDLCSSEGQVAFPSNPSRERRGQAVWGLESHYSSHQSPHTIQKPHLLSRPPTHSKPRTDYHSETQGHTPCIL